MADDKNKEAKFTSGAPYKTKNFANPKTMFKSTQNNDEEFSTAPVKVACNKYKGLSLSASKSRVKGHNNQTLASPKGKQVFKGSTIAHGGGQGSSKSSGSYSSSGNGSTTRSTSSGSISGSRAPAVTFIDNGLSDCSGNENDSCLANQATPRPKHHPLNSTWTLWYLENDRSKTWEEMLHEVTNFNTVENFWSLINHIKPPSDIKLGSDYCLFKKGIRPMWEDDANRYGGRWVINLNKSTKSDLDNFWLDTMLCMIGECCEYSSELCGAVINIRGKNNKISVWTADGNNEAAALEIGSKLRESLRMDNELTIQYQLHKDSMSKQNSIVKSVYNL